MVLRDKRLWWGVLAAVLLAFVSYAVVSNLSENPSDRPDALKEQVLTSGTPGTTATSNPPIPETDAAVPGVLNERLNQARAKLTAAGLTNIKVEDSTGQNRIVIDDNNWIVERQSPSPDLVVDKHTMIVLGVRKPTDTHSPQGAGWGVMPDVVCANLQDAQDVLRKSGFFVLTSKDASPANRVAVFDRNWVVIAQSEKAGTKPSLTTHIVLTVVKYGEPTNNPACES